MNFLKGAFSAVQTHLKNLAPQAKPFEVLEFSLQQLSRLPVVVHEDSITLYKDGDQFMCALHFPLSAPKVYSLFRLADMNEAMSVFSGLCHKLPPLYSSSRAFMTKDMLQSCMDTVNEERGWGCAHLAAKLQLLECFRHPAILQHVSEADAVTHVTPIMVAVETGNVDMIQELVLTGVPLHMADTRGQNVFHYAARGGNPRVIQILASKDRSAINQLNLYGESAVHVACTENHADVIEHLIRWGADPTATMSDRYPIHCALKNDNIKCAEKLIHWSREQLFVKDKKYSGSPLHWAKSREAIHFLTEKGADLDAKNKDGETPIHIMLQRERLECVIGLLVQGADAACAGKAGNNALHLAIERESFSMVQALIVFGSDVNYMNENGCTPRHLCAHLQGKNRAHILYLLHRVGAKRCPKGVSGCNDGCEPAGTFDGMPLDKEVNAPVVLKQALDDVVTEHTMTSALKRTSSKASQLTSAASMDHVDNAAEAAAAGPGERVLCLDGGGIRGLVLIVLLQAIEKATGKPIHSLFDWVGGTSTGGILALGLCVGKPTRYLLSLYFKLKDVVFKGSRPYESEALENFLKKEFGENTRMTEIQHPKVLVTGVLGDRNPADLHIFKNYETPSVCHETLARHAEFELPPRPHEQYIWRAARSSGAAPTYFRPFGRFLDGGLMANNPTLDVLTEIHEYHMGLKATNREKEVRPIHVVVSLGTGRLPVKPVNTVEVYWPSGPLDVYSIYKNVVGAKNLGLLFVEAATQSEGRPVERAQAWCSMIGVPFFRFSPKLTADVPIDCTDDAQLIATLWQCQCYIADHWAKFQQLATVLS